MFLLFLSLLLLLLLLSQLLLLAFRRWRSIVPSPLSLITGL